MDKIFKTLGEKSRIELLSLINARANLCLCHIEKCFDLSTSNLSRHLKELELAELINSNKQGKWKYYTISPLGQTLINFITEFDDPQLTQSINQKLTLLCTETIC